jgi:hypothetical protein
MNHNLALSIFLALATSVGAQPITYLVLNPREVVVVPVALDRVSLVTFPTPFSHLEGAYLSTNAEPRARFQINYRPGSAYFSVRALVPDASAAVTVIWNRKVFVFELIASTRPTLALTLVEPVARETKLSARGPTASRLLGMLDTAKAYSVLRTQHPEEVADVVYLAKSDRYEYGGFELRLEEVFKFKSEDALVFRVVLRNKNGTAFQYQPQSFRIQVGAQTYYAAIADGDGRVPPQSSVPVYFAIASAPDGSRLGLALQNDFRILFSTGASAPWARSNHLRVPSYPTP